MTQKFELSGTKARVIKPHCSCRSGPSQTEYSVEYGPCFLPAVFFKLMVRIFPFRLTEGGGRGGCLRRDNGKLRISVPTMRACVVPIVLSDRRCYVDVLQTGLSGL